MDTDTISENNEKIDKIKIHKRITWADAPPPIHTPKPKLKVKKVSRWDAVADKIRSNKKHAGRWALVASNVHFTIVTRLKRQYPDIDWTVRKSDEGHNLWASLKIENHDQA